MSFSASPRHTSSPPTGFATSHSFCATSENGSSSAGNGNAVTLRQQSNVSLLPCRPACGPPPPANTPLDKHYHHFGCRILAGHWKLFSARSVLGDREASVFIFEKKSNVKAPPRIGRINRLTLVDLIKYDVTQLASLAHPRILHVLHSLEEDKEMLAFATERVHASLETMVLEGGVDKLEMKLGILQIIDGLSYLHNSVKILHGNLTPSSIYVTTSRLWKIAGFSFSVSAKEPGIFPCFPWTKKLPSQLQPDLDFLAPEYLAPNQHTVTPAADVFSLGVLICWICAGHSYLSIISQSFERASLPIFGVGSTFRNFAEVQFFSDSGPCDSNSSSHERNASRKLFLPPPEKKFFLST